MKNYIETRKTWIKAIHKCIMEKWNPICMGCVEIEPACSLCVKGSPFKGDSCGLCSLGKAGMECNIDKNNPYEKWDELSGCNRCPQQELDICNCKCPSVISRPAEAEAMLEALVQLLPPSERVRYGNTP